MKGHKTAEPCANTETEEEEKLRELKLDCLTESLKGVKHQTPKTEKQKKFCSEVEVLLQRVNAKLTVIITYVLTNLPTTNFMHYGSHNCQVGVRQFIDLIKVLDYENTSICKTCVGTSQ